MKLRKQGLPILLLFCLFAAGSGQRPGPVTPQQGKPEEDVVRITANLVQIDATVTDKSGKPITDLRLEEFQVFQDGRPQQITHLTYVSTEPSETAKPGGPKTGSPATKAPALAPAVPLRPEQVHRTIALVVDDINLSFVSTAFVRKTLTRYINEQMQPGDLVAIIRTSAGAGALQQFTSDRRQLQAAVDQIRWYSLGRGMIGVFTPIGPDPLAQAADTLRSSVEGDRAAANAARIYRTSEAQKEEISQLREEAFAVGTLGAVKYVVSGLDKLPGRKSIVLLSDGIRLFTPIKQSSRSQTEPGQPQLRKTNEPGRTPNTRILDALHRLTDAANRASVVVYTMDVRGLQTFALTAEDNVVGTSSDRLAQQLMDRRGEFFDTQAGLAYLAGLTGGMAIQNENDLSKGLQRVLDDQAGYYLIGYRPDESTFDPKTANSNFHKISIKINRPGVRVRSRSGFFGVSDAEARARRSSGGSLAEVLASPFGAADVHLRLTSLFGEEERVGPLMSSVLYIDGRDLSFKEEPDGWHEAEIEVAAYTFGAFGEVVDSLSRNHKIRARGELYDSILRDGLLYTVNVPIKKAGAYQLRVAVRDSATKRVGTASQFIQVPDLSKNRLALSGIFLSGIDLKKARQNYELDQGPEQTSGGDQQASPALRRFRGGMEMHYAYYIYNAKLDVAHHPQLTTQIKLFHESQLAYEGKVTPYEAGQEPDLKRLRAGGRITLSAKSAPGQYVLQVIVSDKLARDKDSTTTQSMDFEIVK